MPKDVTKNEREQVRNGRTARLETAEPVPLVSAKRGKFESLKDAKIEAVVFARLKDYKAFVKDIEGEEPDDGAIVSAGLEMLFEADKNFERWQQEQRKRGRRINGRSGSDNVAKNSTTTATS